MTAPPPLDYAPPAPRRARKIAKYVIGVLLLIAILLSGWAYGPWALRRGDLLITQHRCLVYSQPPEKEVYEEDPIESAKLFQSDANYSSYRIRRNIAGKLAESDTFAAAYIPACWRQFSRATSTDPLTSAIVYLGERTSFSGHRRLICIRYYAETFSFTPDFRQGYNCATEVITPATITRDSDAGTYAALARFHLAIGTAAHDQLGATFAHHAPNVRIFAGQSDPNDASKFTIRYQMWGQTDTLDGQLTDADEITLKPRHAPRELP